MKKRKKNLIWIVLAWTFVTRAAMAEALPTRALFWNFSYPETVDKDGGFIGAVAYLKKIGVTEVHLWTNPNNPPFSCDYVVNYADVYWTAPELRRFIQTLRDNHLDPVLTFSPIVPTDRFVNSLTQPNGLFMLANEFDGLDVELDLEGYWTEAARTSSKEKACKTNTIEHASKQILDSLKIKSPKSRLRITLPNNDRFIHDNTVFVQAAAVVSPQLYGEKYQLPTMDARKSLSTFEQRVGNKIVLPGLSVQCSTNDGKANCGARQFGEQLRWVDQLHAMDPTRYPGYVIWAREELKPLPKPKNQTYSTFGERYLICTAGSEPDQNCE